MSRRLLSALPIVVAFAATASISGQQRGRGAGVALPDGPGKPIAEAQCAACHALSLVTNSGPGRVNIREGIVPSLGSRPHDPLATPDGMIWWTGQFASVIGRLDPRTGQMKEFKTKTPASGPHGLTAHTDGH